MDVQLPTVITSSMLASTPGTTYSYSNLGYMILARLAVGITNTSWITLVRDRFPAGAPIYAASNTVAVPASPEPCTGEYFHHRSKSSCDNGTKVTVEPSAGAAEPSLYYIQSPDGALDVSVMSGNGDIVSNVATLSWIATQYHIGYSNLNAGKSFQNASCTPGEHWGCASGSMPGTLAVVVQYCTPGGSVASFSAILNTRTPNWRMFFKDIYSAMFNALINTFSNN